MAKTAAETTAMTMAGLNLIQQGLSIYDQELRLVVCNRRFRDMFTLPTDHTETGARFEDTIRLLVERGEYGVVEDVATAVAARVEQAKTFTPHYMERRRSNGEWISVEGCPLPQGGWVTVYTDITRIKQQETMLRARSEELSDEVLANAEQLSATIRALEATVTALEETKQQLQDTEARTRQTTEMMPAHIAHVGADGIYTFSNRQLSSVMPGRPAEIVGRSIKEALGPSIFPIISPHLDRAFNGQPSVFEFFDEQSSRRIRVAFTPDDSPGGQGGVYILSMDVTRESQARTALQQTRRREIAAQLTSGMAHDFSNLLTIVLGSQSRLRRLDLPEAAASLIDATLAAAHRGGSLLNRIADITGAREWAPQPTDVKLLLDDLNILAATVLPERFSFHVSNLLRDKYLLFDSGMLQDSLLNLILNARDACGKSGEISLTVAPVQTLWVEFILEDTGPGFSDRALEHALEPFFTTKGREGSGLGLSMVYDMAKLAGGRVGISNTETGARVSLRLPLKPCQSPLRPGLVLLVEDSADIRESVREMLTDMGNTVVEAASAEEALQLLDDLPDISRILSDISLSGGSALDLLAARPASGPPLSLMTSLPPEHKLYQQAAVQAPILRKPFTRSQLTQFLQQDRATA